MADHSAIEWTDATWNPTTGCTKVSPGCAHCYIERTPAFRMAGNRFVHGKTDITVFHDRLDQPLHWRRPRRVFVNSLSDLFHDDIGDAFVDQVFAVMALAPQHTFQVLTKRAERMRAYFAGCAAARVAGHAQFVSKSTRPFTLPSENVFSARAVARGEHWAFKTWPLPNLWLGVSVENQHFADERIPLLLETPATVRFISAEPLLGPVNVERYVRNARTFHVSADVQGMLRNRSFDWISDDDGERLTRQDAEQRLWALHAKGVKLIPSTDACVGFSDQTGCPGHPEPRLDWVIVGGESGPSARPFDLNWARSIIAQCQATGVACFVKQLGTHPIGYVDDQTVWTIEAHGLHDRKGGDPDEWPKDLRVRQFPEAPAHE